MPLHQPFDEPAGLNYTPFLLQPQHARPGCTCIAGRCNCDNIDGNSDDVGDDNIDRVLGVAGGSDGAASSSTTTPRPLPMEKLMSCFGVPKIGIKPTEDVCSQLVSGNLSPGQKSVFTAGNINNEGKPRGTYSPRTSPGANAANRSIYTDTFATDSMLGAGDGQYDMLHKRYRYQRLQNHHRLGEYLDSDSEYEDRGDLQSDSMIITEMRSREGNKAKRSNTNGKNQTLSVGHTLGQLIYVHLLPLLLTEEFMMHVKQEWKRLNGGCFTKVFALMLRLGAAIAGVVLTWLLHWIIELGKVGYRLWLGKFHMRNFTRRVLWYLTLAKCGDLALFTLIVVIAPWLFMFGIFGSIVSLFLVIKKLLTEVVRFLRIRLIF